MLSSFLAWARQVQANRGLKKIEVLLTEGPKSDNPSARLDIDTPTSVARITCWESGDYDAEVIDIETERTIYSSHGVLDARQAIAQQVSAFLEALEIETK